jgi:hypothetical protein
MKGADSLPRDAGGIDPTYLEQLPGRLDAEFTPRGSDFQRSCCELNASGAVQGAADAVFAMGSQALVALFAELIAGRDPADAIQEYAALGERVSEGRAAQ